MARPRKLVTRYQESDSQIELTLRRATTRHLDHFLRLRCSPDLIAQRIFPNAKEITESMAAVYAILRNGRLDSQDPGVSAICVGDGSTPRTAALLAYRTKWTCWAVDPALTGTWDIDRLHLAPTRVQKFDERTVGPVVVTAVHAHVPMEEALQRLRSHGADIRVAVAIPCCGYEHEAPGLQLRWEGEDWGIWSHHRTVRIWTT